MISRKIAGIQDLYPRVMVAVERRYCTRATGLNRVCRVGKPDPEVVRLDCNRPWVQDEGLVIEDAGHVQGITATG